jgi:hypothetical protein
MAAAAAASDPIRDDGPQCVATSFEKSGGYLHVRKLQSWLVAIVTIAAALTWKCPAAAAAVIDGQVDTFQDATLQSWQSGSSNPNPPANIATGGPAGANDHFLRLTSNGGSAGGRLVAFNNDQWTGNYLSAGVDAISMQVNNLGANDLTLRLILVGSGGEALGTSKTSMSPPAAAGPPPLSPSPPGT